MRRHFFIFSLPRSGSAWLSAFLSGRDCYCFHEPTADTRIPELHERFFWRPETVVGAVDTGAFLWADQIKRALPNAQFAVLRRDPKDIQRSCDSLELKFDVEGHERTLREATEGMLEIRYEDMFSKQYLSNLWENMVGTPFDAERAEQFLELHIERDATKFMANRPRLKARA